MDIDFFKEVIVPVVGGLGIFMLGLEFMSTGINNLAANKMRALLAKVAGTSIKGLFSGTLITGILQSSTAMTVMVVGLVNAGVVGLRPAISVIMGANIGTTLGNGLIALPLGPLGLITAGIFALVYVFAKKDKTKNIALSAMGFALIFYGLNLLTGGLKPLRNMPEIMELISSLNSDTFMGLVYCVLTAACITALIHSSSATIGIVMGLGSAGILDWQTAVAFSLGADLGTTITSWMASLNLSKNAKRAAYAHISFNIIGVVVMLPLFFPSMELLRYVMDLFDQDPTKIVMIEGKETYPMVPVAIGIYSICFNIFNTVLLFPFISVFERVLSRIGHQKDDEEDFSTPKYLSTDSARSMITGIAAVQKETARYLYATLFFLECAKNKDSDLDSHQHYLRLDMLSREIRRYTASMMKPNDSAANKDLLASLIEEQDFLSSLGESLYQIMRRCERVDFSEKGKGIVNALIDTIVSDLRSILENNPTLDDLHKLRLASHERLLQYRELCLTTTDVQQFPWDERGSIIELLGSAERAFMLAERISSERQSVSRDLKRFEESEIAQPLASSVLARV